MKTTAIILAAGKGSRMNATENKVFLKLDKPILVHTLEVFEKNINVDDIIIVAAEKEIKKITDDITKYDFNKVTKVVNGGKTRQESSYNGVYATDADSEIFLIHDAARPLVTDQIIDNIILNAKKYSATVAAVPTIDTIKISDENGFVIDTPERKNIWNIQTPQGFKTEIIKKAHEKAIDDNYVGTDESVLVERIGYKVKITKSSYENIKITTKEDIEFAKNILKQRSKKE